MYIFICKQWPAQDLLLKLNAVELMEALGSYQAGQDRAIIIIIIIITIIIAIIIIIITIITIIIGLFESSSVRFGSVRKIEFPGSTRLGPRPSAPARRGSGLMYST